MHTNLAGLIKGYPLHDTIKTKIFNLSYLVQRPILILPNKYKPTICATILPGAELAFQTIFAIQF